MKITVYGAASAAIDNKYVAAVELLGEKLAERGHSLVFGGGKTGLMGAAARGVKKKGGKILGIIPEFFKKTKSEILFEDCDEIIWTADMYQRKMLLESRCDAIIITPGGMGTYDEFFGVLTTKQLKRHSKPIAVFNVDGFYDKLFEFVKSASEKDFIKGNYVKLYGTSNDPDGVLDIIENAEADLGNENFKNV